MKRKTTRLEKASPTRGFSSPAPDEQRRERKRASNRRWRAKNPEWDRLRKRLWRAKNPGKVRAYEISRREQKILYDRWYRASHIWTNWLTGHTFRREHRWG